MIRRFVKHGMDIRLSSTVTNTVDNEEIQQFKSFVAGWWDESGPMKPLHSMNKLRVPFIRDGLINSNAVQPEKINSAVPLSGLSILDVGCGGGILTEPLAILGSSITGIDANSELIDLAKSHAATNKIDINYYMASIEKHSSTNEQRYDAVVASEIVEHVTHKDEFLEACVKCLKPSGSIFVTTISKTCLAKFAGIFLAENILNLLPKDTHHYEKFVEPHQLQRILEENNCRTELIHGMFYNFMTNNWSWIQDTSVNYVLHAVKLKQCE